MFVPICVLTHKYNGHYPCVPTTLREDVIPCTRTDSPRGGRGSGGLVPTWSKSRDLRSDPGTMSLFRPYQSLSDPQCRVEAREVTLTSRVDSFSSRGGTPRTGQDEVPRSLPRGGPESGEDDTSPVTR